jgi:hypothetical protein
VGREHASCDPESFGAGGACLAEFDAFDHCYFEATAMPSEPGSGTGDGGGEPDSFERQLELAFESAPPPDECAALWRLLDACSPSGGPPGPAA